MSDSSPRVAVNALALRPGGDAARTFLENVLRRLPDAWPGAEFCILVRDGVELEPGARTRVVRAGSIRSGAARVFEELTRLPRVLQELRPDVLINPNESVPGRLRVPLVVVAQNLLWHCPGGGPVPDGPLRTRVRSRLQAAYYRRQMPRAYARSAVVVCVSRQAAEVLAERARLDPARVRVVPCGADRLPVLERRPPAGRRTLVVVGAVAHYKRLDVAVRALAELGDGYELLLVGEVWPGAGESVNGLARELHVEQRVRLIGPVPDTRLAEIYASAHASLALSACESFGIPVVEGLRAGLPAIGADERWLEELAGDAVVRVPPEPAAVAEAVRGLEDVGEWERRAQAGAAAAAPYTWTRTAVGLAAAAAEAAGLPEPGA